MAKRKTIEIGSYTYFIDQITSVSRIFCEYCEDSSNCETLTFRWVKQYNLGGDDFEIYKYFKIPHYIKVNKKHWWSPGYELNPAWIFWKELKPYQEFCKAFKDGNPNWMQYCIHIAINTNSLEAYNEVEQKAKEIDKLMGEVK